MRFLYFSFILVLLAGCAAPRHADAPAPIPITVTYSPRTIESFRFIGPDTTMQQVFALVGHEDRDLGSGICIYEYQLSDGTHIWIGSADTVHIMYVRHGTT